MKDTPSAMIDTLMMIDDNHIDQRMYKRIVSRSGLVKNVVCFSLADEALEHLVANPNDKPDIILLDINMPRMDGYEFLEAVDQAFGSDFSVVVVMLTTSLDPRDKERAKQFPAVKRFLEKPLTPENLEELATLV